MLSISSLLHKVPFVWLLIFFSFGLVAAHYGLNFKYVPIVLVSAVLFLILHLLILKQKDDVQFKHRWMFGFSLASFMFAFGLIIMHQSMSLVSNSRQGSYYMGRIISSPKQCSDNKLKCKVLLTEVSENKLVKSNQPFVADVYLPIQSSDSSLQSGDSLLISSQLQVSALRNPELDLKNDGDVMFVEDGAWQIISHSDGCDIETLRSNLINELKKKQAVTLN